MLLGCISMRISHIKLQNWRNFKSVDVDLPFRVFLIGPNASGKSNFLDAIRFLRDVASAGGGFQHAVALRGGVSKIRCLSTRQRADITIEVRLSNGDKSDNDWTYSISFSQDNNRRPVLKSEKVARGDHLILERPDEQDKQDAERKSQTSLEQITANLKFREIPKFFGTIQYLHLVPQIIRNPEGYSTPSPTDALYGRDFLARIAGTTPQTRDSRLNKIRQALKIAVPQFSDLKIDTDTRGVPHLVAYYEHWRPHDAKQLEDQFSDGTIRLIGLLWSLLDGEGTLLLEEPELSLHAAIVRKLPPLIHKMQRLKKAARRQVLVSTHSAELLMDHGIGGEETLLLTPSTEGTRVTPAVKIKAIKELLEQGLPVGEVAMPHTEPENIHQLELPFSD